MFADALTRPLRTEAQVVTERQVLKDRAELYERMLSLHEQKAAYMARLSWEQRHGHAFGYLNCELLAWAPLPHTAADIAAATLHPDVAMEFWTKLADDCCDWVPIADGLRDSAPDDASRWKAEQIKSTLTERIKRARDFVKLLRAETARRAQS